MRVRRSTSFPRSRFSTRLPGDPKPTPSGATRGDGIRGRQVGDTARGSSLGSTASGTAKGSSLPIISHLQFGKNALRNRERTGLAAADGGVHAGLPAANSLGKNDTSGGTEQHDGGKCPPERRVLVGVGDRV